MDFLVELLTLDLDVGRGDGLHVGPGAAESHTTTPDRILVFVGVNSFQSNLARSSSFVPLTCINHSSEEIIEDMSEALGIEHAVESSDKNSLLRVKPVTRSQYNVWRSTNET